MAIEFAKKLRMTARALGCATQKELCARFREVNPATYFQLGNSYKWIQGRAVPRSGTVYEDWAAVLDLGLSGPYLRDCPVAEFAEALARRYGQIPDDILDVEDRSGGSTHALLTGDYAVYSPAWSLAARDQVIRGSLSITLDSERAPLAVYEELVPGGALSFSGPVTVVHRSLHFTLADKDHRSTLLLSCHAPTPPGNLLTGLMAGSAYHDPESRPTAVRMLCLRQLDDSRPMSGGNRYLNGGAEELSADLASIGYRAGNGQDLAALCLAFLQPANLEGRLEVPLSDQATLSAAFDSQYFAPGT